MKSMKIRLYWNELGSAHGVNTTVSFKGDVEDTVMKLVIVVRIMPAASKKLASTPE